MTRRGDPLRIFASQRAGLFMRLTSEGGLSASSADRWLDVWVETARAEHGDARTSRFWDGAYEWCRERARGASGGPA
jgi:hypothetical protein